MKKKTHEEMYVELGNLARELGWVIAIPISEDNSGVQGMVIGDAVFVYDILKEEQENYDVFTHGGNGVGEDGLH